MPKGSRPALVFFTGILIGSAAIIVVSTFLKGAIVTPSHAQTGSTQDIPFVCLSNCIVVGPSQGNGPGFGSRFAGKDLSGAYIGDFQSSGGNNFSRVILRGAYLPNLSSSQGDMWHNADFSNAWMQGANLDADFSGANFSGVNLSNANLSGNFSGANFSGANLSNTNLSSGGNFSGANFNGVNWSNVTCPDGHTASQNGCNLNFQVTP